MTRRPFVFLFALAATALGLLVRRLRQEEKPAGSTWRPIKL
jgi:hypothetical protein